MLHHSTCEYAPKPIRFALVTTCEAKSRSDSFTFAALSAKVFPSGEELSPHDATYDGHAEQTLHYQQD